MLDHFGGGDRAEPQRLLRGRPARLAEQEAGGEQVAGAGRVDQFARSARPATSARSPPRMASAPSSLRVTTRVSTFGRDRRDRALEVRDAGQRLDLGLVGEQDVDPAVVDQLR